jgi:hypothetical protein
MTPCYRLIWRLLAVVLVLAATNACGDVVRQGRSPVVVVVDSLSGAPGGGANAGKFSATLSSDVIVLLTTPAPCTTSSPCPTIYGDAGQVIMHLTPKDAGIAPTSNNQVTLSQYHVSYRRADGRSTPGVDVPFPFDGAITGTIPSSGSATFSFDLVRLVAKKEAPLVQLETSPNLMTTIADVSFYGSDLVGNTVSATGSISITFGNFGDQ